MKKISLIIALLFATATFAQSGLKMQNLKFEKVGVRLGLYDGDLGFGLTMPMGNLYGDFGFATTVDYKSKEGVKFTSLGLRGCYRLKNVKMPNNMKLYTGAGLAFHHISWDNYGITSIDSSWNKFGVDGFIGVGYPIKKGMCIKGEAAYRMTSDFSHLALTGTFVYKFR